ncbi:hypothetical protein JCM10908_003621 [Rhodotorula pacifica]|uniref:uncharacterized protein n=1 Tax=Rhodotorula pacifica TaxID=1495444 RepID=UPI00317A86C2
MDVSGIVGPILLGSCFSCLTCGLLLSLAARYWAIFSRDEWYVRTAVVVGALYGLADTAVNCAWAYRWAVSDFVKPRNLALLPWQLTAFCVFLGAAAWAVQNFYLARLFFLSRRNWLICVPIAIAINICFALSLYMGYYCSQNTDSLTAFKHLSHFVTPWMAGALASDLATLDWSQVPRKLMQTNAPSTLYQLALVCLHARYPQSLRFNYLGFCSSKIYLGTFIATCNARDPHGSLSFDEMVDTRRLKGLGPSGLPPVHVEVEQERRVDGDDNVSGTTFEHRDGLGEGESNGGSKGRSKPSSYGMQQFRVDFDAAAPPPDFGDEKRGL